MDNNQAVIRENDDFLEKVILGEIEGKNRAIHAYDGMVWKIRTGFLTLLFGGWAILLKGIITESTAGYGKIILGLFLFSLGFAFGAWYVDRNYVRRKFRVILALDRLTEEIRSCRGAYLKIAPELLKVAGDNADMSYDSKGYREAVKAELSVYLVPLVILAGVLGLVV